jgi:hypothetical protein
MPATTFTFLHVELPERLRGRGALLVVRLTSDRSIAETDSTNNKRELGFDGATDWACRR